MAKNAAQWEGRRALTDNPATSAPTYQSAALTLMELDQLCEASVMCGRAEDDDGLMKIIDTAVEEGNFFLFQAAASRLKEQKPDRSRVQALISAAEKGGKLLYAEKAQKYLEAM